MPDLGHAGGDRRGVCAGESGRIVRRACSWAVEWTWLLAALFLLGCGARTSIGETDDEGGGAGQGGGRGDGGRGDGGAAACDSGSWTQVFAGAGAQEIEFVGAHGCSIAVGGAFTGLLAIGGPALKAENGAAFVAAFGVDGTLRWQRMITGGEIAGFGQGPAGDVAILLWGGPEGFDFGDHAHTAGDLAVARFNPSGTLVYAKGGSFNHMGNDGLYGPVPLVVDAEGGVSVAFWFQGQLEIAGAKVASTTTSYALFGLDPDGAPRGSAFFPTDTANAPSSGAMVLEPDGEGGLYFGADFTGTVDADIASLKSDGMYGAFVVHVDPAFSATWARAFGGGQTFISAGASGPAGTLLVGGSYGDTLNLGPDGVLSGGGSYLVTLGSDGTLRHATGVTPDVAVQALAVGPTGAVVVGGVSSSATNFGGEMFTAPPGGTSFIANIDDKGQLSSPKRIVDNSNSPPMLGAIAIDGAGRMVVGGVLESGDRIEGSAPLSSTEGQDAFLVSLP